MFAHGVGFVPDEVIPDAKVKVYLQNPGSEEEREGKPAIGATGNVLNDTLLPRAGLQRGKDVSVCNAIRCRWQGSNDLPPKPILMEAIKHCRQYDTVGTEKLIVAAGAVAWLALGCPGSITDWRGFLAPVPPVSNVQDAVNVQNNSDV
jgi:DNA polymerase